LKKSPSNKLSEEYVYGVFKEKGCIPIDKYINVLEPMRYICHCGRENKTSFHKFRKQKHGCKYCTKIGGYSHEEVVQYFKDNDCELLDIYSGIKIKMKYKCICGNISHINFDNFKNGKRCVECGLKKLSEQFRENIDNVRKNFEKNNCIPLFDQYNNDRDKLKFQCICGNISYITYADFKVGKRCSNCRITRANETKFKHGKVPVSTQQIYIHNLIGGILNYPEEKSCLDIAFLDEKIYVEYDGSGHDLTVKLKTISQEQFDEKSKRRRYALYRRGWKEIRIISKKDLLPNIDKIKELFIYGKEILKKHSWVLFDIDNQELKFSNHVEEYNFGKLKRVKKEFVETMNYNSDVMVTPTVSNEMMI